jgi:hypothetical protein
LSDGVTVTQRPLEALFMVRIHVGQPTLSKFLISDWRFTIFSIGTNAPFRGLTPLAARQGASVKSF